jgi:hypothetical protein
MTTLRLALRGLRARAGLSAALLAVATFAVGVGAAGAVYLRAAGESLLAHDLRTATSYTAGLHVDQVVADGKELRSLTQSVAAAGPLVPALAPPVSGLETRTPVSLLAPGGRPGAAYLASRDGLCEIRISPMPVSRWMRSRIWARRRAGGTVLRRGPRTPSGSR